MTDPQPCRVIGVLDDGAASLSPTALALLRRADVVVGGSTTLVWPASRAAAIQPGTALSWPVKSRRWA